ncbi:MAG: sulfotransferase [Sphingomonas bacterium]|uniref:tetratricopeptide repeat-containing sulfotransferase family protein n=1 Tax=Sphingomonas bacterium TaxID=1895847 RepID=UPI00262E00A4|nr:tetratricopeptide repeat-containing sulfotransferase family protein [Sphingomonas bacterium]MDB5703004.1 sulfotransferase [Sphingomonas bacterium]
MTDMQTTVTAYPMLSDAADLMEQGRLEQAAQRTIEHLRKHPDEPRGLAQLGQIAMQLGALGQAEHFLRQALARGAGDLDVRRNLASILNQQERLGEACSLFESLELETDDPTLPAIRALILSKLGRHDEAMAVQEGLTGAHGSKPHHWISYGHSLRADGQVQEAIDAYRNAIAADFECGEAWWGLASIKRTVFTDDDIGEMRKALGVAVDVRNTAPLHFALARALQDREQYEEAFTHYAEGNSQRAESIGYDARELTAEVAEIERSVDPAFVASLDREPVGDGIPVFIVSLPRSGSTLLEQMLGSHPGIEPVGELPYVPAILRSVMEMATRRGPVSVPQLIAGLSAEQAATMGRDYLQRATLHRKTDRPYFVDKLPHNWSNILFIRRILPQARFIDIRRAPMDCCFSNFTQSFSSAHASSFALRDIGQCYVDYVQLMEHLDRVAPGMIHHISYERLVEDAETEIRAVLDYLGLPWNPSVLDFHKLDRVVRTPSSEQVRRPLNRDGMDGWKPYAEWLGPLRDTLGPLAE